MFFKLYTYIKLYELPVCPVIKGVLLIYNSTTKPKHLRLCYPLCTSAYFQYTPFVSVRANSLECACHSVALA